MSIFGGSPSLGTVAVPQDSNSDIASPPGFSVGTPVFSYKPLGKSDPYTSYCRSPQQVWIPLQRPVLQVAPSTTIAGSTPGTAPSTAAAPAIVHSGPNPASPSTSTTGMPPPPRSPTRRNKPLRTMALSLKSCLHYRLIPHRRQIQTSTLTFPHAGIWS